MRQAAAGAAHALRRLVLGRCLSRAMVRGSFPRAHTSLQNALKPHLVGTRSSRGLLRRASLARRSVLRPRRLGREEWMAMGAEPRSSDGRRFGAGTADRTSRSRGITRYRVVKGFGFSDWWCVLSGKKRIAERADRNPSLLGSSPWPANRELRCALRSDYTDAT
jgi:hypothetical protein